MMADGKNNHKRKELDSKLDANTMDNVEYQKEKLKIVHQRSWIHIRDPKWVEHTLNDTKAAEPETIQSVLINMRTPAE